VFLLSRHAHSLFIAYCRWFAVIYILQRSVATRLSWNRTVNDRCLT